MVRPCMPRACEIDDSPIDTGGASSDKAESPLIGAGRTQSARAPFSSFHIPRTDQAADPTGDDGFRDRRR